MLARTLAIVPLLLSLLGPLVVSQPALAAPAAAPSVTDPRLFVGANVPWLNFGCDFGCGGKGGVSDPGARATLADGFGWLKAAGVHTVRWWTFEGDPVGIARNSSGPTGLNPAVYADFDAALALADQYDLVYDFVLFASPTAIPRGWVVDPAQRQRLADTLAPLFERYKNNPRILAWEIVNEPEWDMWNDRIPTADVQATVKLLASTIHAHTTTSVTVGSATLEGLRFWTGLGLDFYSPHWYDPMNSGVACARCSDVPTLMGVLGVEQLPIVLGEFYASPDKDSLQRWQDFRAKGFAGAWAWSLFSDHTADHFKIDLDAARSFTSSPVAPAVPTVSPADAAPKAELLASWISPTYAAQGEDISIHQDVRTNRDASVLVDFEVYSDSNQKVWQSALDNQALSANNVSSMSVTFTLPASLPPGQYTVKSGVFAPDWGTMYAWSDLVGSFVVDAPPPPPPAPATDTAPTDPPAPESGDGGE